MCRDLSTKMLCSKVHESQCSVAHRDGSFVSRVCSNFVGHYYCGKENVPYAGHLGGRNNPAEENRREPTGSCMWVAGTQVFELPPAARRLELEAELWDWASQAAS